MHSIDTMARWAKRAGLAATVLTAAITARFGWMQGEDLVTSCVYAGGLALASFLVGYGLVFAWAAHKQRLHWSVIAACCALFAIAVAVEMLSHLGATASARTHDMARATEQTHKHTDIRSDLDQARADLAAMKPGRTPGAIASDLRNIETKPWFASTAQCTNPRPSGSGKGYGNSCNRFHALKSELATAQERGALDKRVQALSAKASDSSGGHSVTAAQTTELARYASFSLRPTADDKQRTNMAIQLVLALYFVSIGLLNLIAHAIDGSAPPPARKREADVFAFPTELKPVPQAEISVGRAIIPKVA